MCIRDSPGPLQEALDVAHDRILAYHAHEAADPEADDFVSGGIEVRHLVRPVTRAGCYAPVSYTHLDVYKRQSRRSGRGPPGLHR